MRGARNPFAKDNFCAPIMIQKRIHMGREVLAETKNKILDLGAKLEKVHKFRARYKGGHDPYQTELEDTLRRQQKIVEFKE